MLSLKDIQKKDIKKMHKSYEKWPQIARDSYENESELMDLKNIDHFIFAGMGGSGALGDVFNSIMSKTNTHVSVIKGYKLPKTIDENTLVICTSVSGNTQETLSILEQVKKKSLKSISFSSNGKIEKYCLQNNLEYRFVEQNHSPRVSFVGFLYKMLKVLGPMLPISEMYIIDSIEKNGMRGLPVSGGAFLIQILIQEWPKHFVELSRIILLHIGLMTLHFHFPPIRKVIIFMIFGPSGHVHDFQNRVFPKTL